MVRTIVLLLAGAMVSGVIAPPASARQSSTVAATQTVWDRVFSDAQAARGEAQYRKSCSICHRDDLGGSDGPSLRGPDFFVRWRDQTVADMLEEIRQTMPSRDPDSLEPQVYLDIVSFLFKFNGVPTGTTDLAISGPLKQIVVTEKESR
jgi:cytochrome c